MADQQTTGEATSLTLTGKMLIAMPGMGDPRFDQSVVFMCEHGPEGAMGLIVNKTAGDIDLTQLLDNLSISVTADLRDQAVHFGGPVEMGRGFVLHSPDFASVVTTLPVTDDIHMTATLDILEEIARGQGPDRRLMLLGYAGWGPGQLEAELAQNAWLVCDGGAGLIFDKPDSEKWAAALATLGVDALMLSSEGGRA